MAQLRLEVLPSRQLLMLLILIHVMALISVLLAFPYVPGKGFLCLLILWSFLYSSRRYATLTSMNAVTELMHKEEGWLLVTRKGERHNAELLPNVYTNPVCTIMNFKACQDYTRRHFTVVLMRDALDEKNRCSLLGKLRIG